MRHTADLCDEWGAQAVVCAAPWRSYGGRQAITGTVATVQVRADAGLVRQQLATPGAGRVLVVDAGGSLQHALLGDRLAQLGREHGWAGVLVYGAVRDVQALGQLDFGVFALGSVPARAALQGDGSCGVPVTIAGVCIRPGQPICIDADGVVLRAA